MLNVECSMIDEDGDEKYKNSKIERLKDWDTGYELLDTNLFLSIWTIKLIFNHFFFNLEQQKQYTL